MNVNAQPDLEPAKLVPAFRFDVTPFDESHFADFFEED